MRQKRLSVERSDAHGVRRAKSWETQVISLKSGISALWGICVSGNEKTLREIASEIKSGGMRCNCDLDNWQPEQSTGHSHVCRIHKEAMRVHDVQAK
jgi:hypothetical protein